MKEPTKKLIKASGIVHGKRIGYVVIKVNGTVTFQKELASEHLSIFGIGTFLSKACVDQLNNKGVAKFTSLQCNHIVNTGSLTLIEGTTRMVLSRGQLNIRKELTADQVKARGLIRAKSVEAEQVELHISGRCEIHSLKGQSIHVTPDLLTLSFTRQLFCQNIFGEDIHLYRTKADFVQGSNVHIGPHCRIQQLHFTIDYTIHPTATVKTILKI
ncbi:hypothetical protein G4V62_18690 [Bacillaceae bacterium SIJ1]|uniref:hypothetical protein n=1 Tax=Litoribacterium kuwaitense TaxID=1398745 RepID=UPI0013EB8F5F|nr:hypothetical protein [Litoribacterium kuwaitense]NGP46867.1 hypothetical protein [Litoribacterium kuwaitense]